MFHPKISVLSSADECHVLVGSGNLTFGGWGGNWEILEHLHPGFAADAIADAADFFELMPANNRIRQSATGHCAAIAADLRRAIQGRPRNGDIRLLHNLDRSLSEQVTQIVADLGGATQIVAAAPFWDDGAAIDRLCEAIGLDRVFLHAHEHGCNVAAIMSWFHEDPRRLATDDPGRHPRRRRNAESRSLGKADPRRYAG